MGGGTCSLIPRLDNCVTGLLARLSIAKLALAHRHPGFMTAQWQENLYGTKNNLLSHGVSTRNTSNFDQRIAGWLGRCRE